MPAEHLAAQMLACDVPVTFPLFTVLAGCSRNPAFCCAWLRMPGVIRLCDPRSTGVMGRLIRGVDFAYR